MRNLFNQIWIPQYKHQLVTWLTKKYGNSNKWDKMTKTQLFAIYFNIRGITEEIEDKT